MKYYTLPSLGYDYKELEPHMSQEQLEIHHKKHHQSYVNGANAILEKLEKARKDNIDLDLKSVLKNLSFNIGGHLLHSLFWENLVPAGKGGGGEPVGKLKEVLETEFGSFERFKDEFSKSALSVEGSGWAGLSICPQTQRPIITQIEKHNTNMYPDFKILMVVDVFEHAYYLDYKNERAKFIDIFWKIINWETVNKRLKE